MPTRTQLIAFLFVLGFGSLNGQASEERLIGPLKKIENGLKNQDCSNCLQETLREEPSPKACIESICGKNLGQFENQYQDQIRSALPHFLRQSKELKSKVYEIEKKAAELQALQLENALHFLKSQTQSNLDLPSEGQILEFIDLFHGAYKQMCYQEKGQLECRVDEQEAMSQLGTLPEPIKRYFLDLFSEVARRAGRDLHDAQVLPPVGYISLQDSSSQLEKGQKRLLLKIQKNLKELTANIKGRPPLGIEQMSRLVESLMSKSTLNLMEMYRLVKTYQQSEFLRLSLISVRMKSNLAIPPLAAYRDWATDSSRLKLVKLNLSKLKNQEFINERAKQSTELCAASYSTNSVMLPTEIQLSDAKKMARLTLDQLDRRLLSRFSQKSRLSLRRALRGATIIYPPSIQEMEKLFSEGFDSELNELRESLAYEQKIGSSTLPMTYTDLKEPGFAKGRAAVFCDQFHFPNEVDAAYSRYGIITASTLGIKDKEIFSARLAHEYGHILDFKLSQKFGIKGERLISRESKAIYLRSKMCLTRSSFHADSEKTKDHYFHEDWSDLVMSKVGSKSSVNPWCASIKNDDSILNRLSLISEDSDEHAPILFRLLHVEWIRKVKWTNACQRWISKSSEKGEFKNCSPY